MWRPLQPRILRLGSFSFNNTDTSLFTFYEAYNLVEALENWPLIVNSANKRLWKNDEGEREFT
jgi:hypothetical protein